MPYERLGMLCASVSPKIPVQFGSRLKGSAIILPQENTMPNPATTLAPIPHFLSFSIITAGTAFALATFQTS